MENFWQAIKTFLDNRLLEYGLLHLFFLGLGIALVLMIIIIYRTNKDIKKMEKDKRKRDKAILKFLSNKKNRTY